MKDASFAPFCFSIYSYLIIMFVIYLKYDDFAEQKRPHFSYFSPPIDTQLRGKAPELYSSLYIV